MKRDTRTCTIDVGTNAVNTLVAEIRDSKLHVLVDEERFTRLGEGVDSNGWLTEAAIERVMVALTASVETARRFEAESVIIAGTSASRDARNVDELEKRVDEALALHYEVLSGDEEARWSAVGALALLEEVAEALVIDIGGGSTEIVRIKTDGKVSFQTSLDVGTVRLTERHFSSIPPAKSEVAAAREVLETHLESISTRLAHGTAVVSTGSTARVIAALLNVKMQTRMASSDVSRLAERLLMLSPEEACALAPAAVRGREDLVAAAGLILSAVLEHLRVAFLIPSTGGLRHGLVLRALAGKAA